MSSSSAAEIYFSFFMFTTDLKPENSDHKLLIQHLLKLTEMGYDGFDLHIAQRAASVPHQSEIDSYKNLKDAFNKHKDLVHTKFATNVGTTQFFDPTSPYKEQRDRALAYLKSRIDITKVLGGESAEPIMSGPFIYPYGVFPQTDLGEPIWSDALQDWIKPRFRAALPIIEALAEYAAEKKVKLAIEPVKNWETPPPNMVSEALNFLDDVKKASCGITIDTAQVLMESQGVKVFKENVCKAWKLGRLNYVHISAPDRGDITDSWIPWDLMLGEIEPKYAGPYLIEVFNAIPPLDGLMRMTRRRFWVPDVDEPRSDAKSAYQVAEDSLITLKDQLSRISKARRGREECPP